MADSTQAPASLKLEVDGPLAWIVADNPARMNAFTAAMWGALPGLVASAEEDERVRILIFRGSGTRAFSAGADISEFENVRTGDNAKAYDEISDKAFQALISARKPTLAMIHGFCLGGGLGVAACCDMRIADSKAEFAIPAAKLGIGYNARWVRPLLAILPPPRVKEIIFTGQRFKASEAHAMGLVNRVVGEAELEASVRALAGDIAANAPLTIGAAKLAIDELTRHPENPDSARMDAAVGLCFDSADYAEGRRAFLEKRKPQFVGR